MSTSLRNLLLNKAVPFVFSRPAAQPVNRALFRIAAIGMGVSSFDGTQSDERRFLRRIAGQNRNPIVLDVGANSGQYAKLVRDEIPGAEIYSFEPHPVAFARLQVAAGALGIHAVNVGVGSAEGTAELHDYEQDPGSTHASLIPGVIEQLHHGMSKSIPIQIITIDSFVAAQAFKHVDLLKVDVEGFELEVLKGARALIEAGSVNAIQLEFNEMSVLSRTFIQDFASALPGYRLHRLLRNGGLLSLSGGNILRRELFCYQNLIALKQIN
jgi:FkbM family methyltransferase